MADLTTPTLPRQSSQDAFSSYDEKNSVGSSSAGVPAVNVKSGVDVAVDLLVGHEKDEEIEPPEAHRLRKKLDWHLLPLLFLVYTVQFIDKGSLASSSILGIIQNNKLSMDEYNTLGSAFYIGFLIFEYPQNWALQRFPVGKWLTLNITLWAVLLGLHPVCKNFGGLFALRFLLGASEGCITAGLMIVTSMFYTRTEIGERIGWTFQCNGIAQILGGFISFGAFHMSPNSGIKQWQVLYVIVCGLTLFIAAAFFLYFPDNPTTAKFLTHDEKVKVVRRIQSNQNGIETKTWKKHQFIETLTDAKTWLFFLFAAVSYVRNLQNGIGVEYALLIRSFGFTTLESTVLNIPSGVMEVIGITLACYCLRKFPNSRAYIAVIFFIPSILAALLEICLPLTNRAGRLAAIYVLNFGGAPSFVLMLSWVTSTSAGHTKARLCVKDGVSELNNNEQKTAVNGIFLIGYGLGQALCSQFWKAKYAPSYRVPWGICLATYIVDIALIMLIRTMLNAENKRRDALQGSTNQGDLGYLETVDNNGKSKRVAIDRGMLDLTDRENLSFRYVL